MKLRTAALRALLALALVTLLAPVAHAKKKEAKPAPEAAAAADKSDKPYGDWKKLTKDAEVMKGFITLYKKRENLYANCPRRRWASRCSASSASRAASGRTSCSAVSRSTTG